MFRITLLFIFILSPFLAFSQERMKEFTYQLKLSTLRLVDPINPGFELSLEKSFNANWSTQISAAYMTDLMKTATYFERIQGYRFGIEEKYFFSGTRFMRPYVAAEAFFYRVNFQASEKFQHDELVINAEDVQERKSHIYTDTFSVNKSTFTLNGKIGVQFTLNTLVFEAFVGLGLKYRDVQHGDRQRPDDKLVRNDKWIPSPKLVAVSEGKYFTLSIPLNVRFGYRF